MRANSALTERTGPKGGLLGGRPRPLVGGYGQAARVALAACRHLRVRLLEHDPQPGLGHGQPRGHGPLGDAQGLGDRAVGVPVVVPQHDGRRLLWRELGERVREVLAVDDVSVSVDEL